MFTRVKCNLFLFTFKMLFTCVINCDASRTSAGVLIENAPQQGQMIPSISKICPLFAERDQNPPRFLTKPSQILPNSSPDLPKSSKIPSQIDQESKKIRSIMILLTFQRPRCVQEAAKSAQKRPKTVPDPCQMKPKTLPNPLLKAFFLPCKIYIEFSSCFLYFSMFF